MGEREQVRPLAPVADHQSSDEGASRHQKKRGRKCCAFTAAIVVILVTAIVAVRFTVFRVKDPIIKMNGVTVSRLELTNGTIPKSGVNISLIADVSVKNPNVASFKYSNTTTTLIADVSVKNPNVASFKYSNTTTTLIADVSVKNPNVASFKYSNTTTTLYYHGQMVGEARNGPGHARPRRTMRMNVSVDIITDRIMSNPSLNVDFISGLLSMNAYTRVPGRMKIVVVKRNIVVEMNCSMALNITTQQIQTQECKQRVDY